MNSVKNKVTISVVLGSYNRLPYLKQTLLTVRQELADMPHEIIIIDGGSTDGTMRWLEEQKDTLSIIQHNRGVFNGKPIKRRSWGYFMNLGFKAAQGKYICMISDDCLIIPGAVKNGIALFEKELSAGHKVGAVAFYYRNWPDEIPYKVSYSLGENIYVNHGLFLKTALEEIDYIDEDNYQFYYGDADLCLRLIQNGFAVIDSPESFIEHYKHANIGLRKTNIGSGNSDLENYKSRWSRVYGNFSLNEGSKEINFNDTSNTVQYFKKLGTVRFSEIKNIIKKFIRK